jgi:hypothetical protein
LFGNGDVYVATYRYNGRLLDDVYVIANDRIHEHTWYEDGTRGWSAPPMGVDSSGDPLVVSHETDGQANVDVSSLDSRGQMHTLL